MDGIQLASQCAQIALLQQVAQNTLTTDTQPDLLHIDAAIVVVQMLQQAQQTLYAHTQTIIQTGDPQLLETTIGFLHAMSDEISVAQEVLYANLNDSEAESLGYIDYDI